MGYAFISYSSKELKTAEKLKNILNKNGIDTWIAPEDIPVGSKYAEVINKAVKNCGCFILLLSNESQASKWVSKELERAINYDKVIIPIRIDDVIFNDEFELYISTDQIIDIRDFSEANPKIGGLLLKVRSCVDMSGFEKYMLYGSVIPNEPQTTPAKKTQLSLSAVIASIAVLCVVVLIAGILIGNANNDLPGTDDKPDTHISDTVGTDGNESPRTEQSYATENEQDMPALTEASETEQTLTTAEADNKNEIPEKYESKVNALKYSNEMSLSLSTLHVKIGQYAAPQAASVWGDVKIYSQNTDIVVGEDCLVKGVSKGETYVIVESGTGSAVAYYVVVE